MAIFRITFHKPQLPMTKHHIFLEQIFTEKVIQEPYTKESQHNSETMIYEDLV